MQRALFHMLLSLFVSLYTLYFSKRSQAFERLDCDLDAYMSVERDTQTGVHLSMGVAAGIAHLASKHVLHRDLHKAFGTSDSIKRNTKWRHIRKPAKTEHDSLLSGFNSN